MGALVTGDDKGRANAHERSRFWRDARRRRMLALADLVAALAATVIVASSTEHVFWGLALLPGLYGPGV